MAAPHAHTLATHLINQTLSSIATLESLSVISASDAQLIRSKLPPPNGPFPSLHAAQQNQSDSFGQMNVSGGAASSPYGGQQPQQYPSPPIHQMQPHSSGSAIPALPPRGKPESRARALWDYSGTEADDLAFRANDTIVIDEEVNEQWYRGRVIPQGQTYALDRSGLFPSNYIEKIQSNSQFPPPQPQAVVPYQTQGPPAPYGGGYQDQKHDQQYQVMPPPHPQHQQLQHQNSSTTVVAQQDPHKPNKFGKLGSKLGDSAVHGAGFGFGASIASNLVNKIF